MEIYINIILFTVNDPIKRAERNGRGVQESTETVGQATAEGRTHQTRVPHGL